MHFKSWDGRGSSYASYPSVHRSEFDVEAVMERSVYARTWELSKRLKRGAEYPMDYVRAVYDYLHRPEFRYTERPAQPPAGEAPLDYFINQTHEGYCQHYAGAMALLLRMGGISARVATGFSPGGYSTRKKAWIVRDTDAHAWVEVWFDRYGWVTFDPTPDATPARSQVAALAAGAGQADAADRSGHRGRRRRRRQRRAPARRPSRAAGSASATTRSASQRSGRRDPLVRVAARRRWAWACWCWPWRCSCAARAGTRRWTARSPRSRTRCGASGGR